MFFSEIFLRDRGEAFVTNPKLSITKYKEYSECMNPCPLFDKILTIFFKYNPQQSRMKYYS